MNYHTAPGLDVKRLPQVPWITYLREPLQQIHRFQIKRIKSRFLRILEDIKATIADMRRSIDSHPPK